LFKRLLSKIQKITVHIQMSQLSLEYQRNLPNKDNEKCHQTLSWQRMYLCEQ